MRCFGLALAFGATSCKLPTVTQTSTIPAINPSATPSPTSTTIADGVRAVKIYFSAATTGSFPTSCIGQTDRPCIATKLYQPSDTSGAQGNLIADGGYTAAAWPKWLKGVDVGMTSSAHSNCARFTTESEATNPPQCHLGDSSSTVACGPQQTGVYRISEVDCQNVTEGNGSDKDPVYIRVFLDRDPKLIGAEENLMITLDYSASVPTTTPPDPATFCFSNGVFDPTRPDCSDMSWSAYIKATREHSPQPFLLFIPPAVPVASSSTRGFSHQTKQFILPLSANPWISLFQLSRNKAKNWANGTNEIHNSSTTGYCDNADASKPTSNSPLCFGVVFYSMTIYRI